jgi:hypothetical protein
LLGGKDDFVKTLDAKDYMKTMTTCVIKSAGDTLAALQYLIPRERLQHDTQLW